VIVDNIDCVVEVCCVDTFEGLRAKKTKDQAYVLPALSGKRFVGAKNS
jgi:hypothetical protein